MPQQAAFFFGSGISFKSNVPSVYAITRSAHKDAWHFTSANTFDPGPSPSPGIPDVVTPAVRKFLEEVERCAADYLTELAKGGTPRQPHYEDLFSLAEQASRPEIDHIPNLAVIDFVRRLRGLTASLSHGFKAGAAGHSGFAGLASTACDFLHWVVHHNLQQSTIKRDGLQLVSEVAAQVDALDIFTLNHDLLVEEQLAADGFPDIEAGFNGSGHGDFRVFSNWPHPTRKRVRLFKLHGSLNWYFYEFPRRIRRYAIPLRGAFHSRDVNGVPLMPLDGGKAAFLSGTIVKEQRYGLGFWGDLFGQFRDHLSKHKHLIVCGYGFGDTGINQRLIQWTSDRLDGSNRLVVLTRDDAATFLADKPGSIGTLFAKGRMVFPVRKYLQDCDISDLSPFFDPL